MGLFLREGFFAGFRVDLAIWISFFGDVQLGTAFEKQPFLPELGYSQQFASE
jgi:hypothetical protein